MDFSKIRAIVLKNVIGAQSERDDNTVFRVYQHASSLIEEINSSEDKSSLVLCFGGEDQSGTWINDIYALNINTFTWKAIFFQQSPRTVGFPPKVDGHSMIQHERELYVFGGNNNQIPDGGDNQIFSLNLDTFEWRVVEVQNEECDPVPEGRTLHSCAYNPVDKCMYVFGGRSTTYQNNTVFNDLYKFDLETKKWHHIASDDAPSPRSGHSCCFYPTRNSLIILGGVDSSGKKYLNDVHEFDLEKLRWKKLETLETPTGRERHTASLLEDSILIYGGWCQGGPVEELHVLDLNTLHWRVIPCFENGGVRLENDRRRYGHTATILNPNQLLIIGGKNHMCQNTPYSIIFCLDGQEHIVSQSTCTSKFDTAFKEGITTLVIDKNHLPTDAYRYTILEEEKIVDEELVNKSYDSLERMFNEGKEKQNTINQNSSFNLDDLMHDIRSQIDEPANQPPIEQNIQENFVEETTAEELQELGGSKLNVDTDSHEMLE